MERKMLDVTVTGLLVLGAAQLAQGACVDPVGFPRNDVDLDGLAFQIASAAPLPVGLEVDMNGIQRGNDQRLWATHGTFVGFVDVGEEVRSGRRPVRFFCFRAPSECP